jgi:hypothetical protein
VGRGRRRREERGERDEEGCAWNSHFKIVSRSGC